MLFRRTVLALLLALVVGCGHQSSVAPHMSSEQHRQVGRQTGVEATFHIFQGPTEVLPPPLRMHLRQLLKKGGLHKFEPMRVQRAQTSDTVAWVFLNGKAMCLAQGNRGGLACSPRARVEAEGLSLGVFTPPSKQIPRAHDFLLMGLWPDQVRKVVVTLGTEQRTEPIRNNLFSDSAERPLLIARAIE
jgi:hypothetical protein